MNTPAPSKTTEAEATQTFFAVCLSLTLCFVVYSMLIVVVPVYGLQLGASPLVLGAVLSAQYLLPLALAIPLGGVVSRFGGRATLITGAGLMVAGLLAMHLWPGFGGLIAGQLLVGLAHLQMVLAAQTIIANLGTGPRLEKYFGWYSTWLSGGQVIGPLLAGLLLNASGTAYVFLVMAAFALVAGLVGLWLTGQATERIQVTRKQAGFRAQWALMQSNRGVQLSVLVTVLGMFALGVYGSYLPVYLESLAISPVIIGVLVSLRAGVSMVIRPFMASIIQLAGGRVNTVLFSLVTVSAGIAFLGATEQIVVMAMLAVLVGIGSGLTQPLSMVILAEAVNRAQRSGALGMRLMANRAIHFLAPLMFGLLLELGGFALAFSASGLAIVATLLMGRKLFKS
ncbi:MAG: MFS transporter [Marinobacter sp.]|uniref:MFS transporter n=1 Tax=Marinobacter sp. TaxID=50741 RepID=UPI0029C3CC48|nr:MFS transporter [Marinobacter sp.]MDX5335521.1 MFS transporter [Marinobacter sp.]MDX5386374.1 MFS transporter [Marinobacter sp.]MDX5440374.1 MFS transporter [Alteromonadaceae bacterium]MDX5471855.1 MFS transporter [Marinobacter sp.]